MDSNSGVVIFVAEAYYSICLQKFIRKVSVPIKTVLPSPFPFPNITSWRKIDYLVVLQYNPDDKIIKIHVTVTLYSM